VIARSCGTSPATIHRHYFVAIDAAEAGDPLPRFEQQLADAVALVDGSEQVPLGTLQVGGPAPAEFLRRTA
jgi:hypothetical protein